MKLEERRDEIFELWKLTYKTLKDSKKLESELMYLRKIVEMQSIVDDLEIQVLGLQARLAVDKSLDKCA